MKTPAQKLRASIWDKVVALAKSEISPYPILIDKEGDCYHYRRLRVCKSAEDILFFDTSTDLYRPLSQNELNELEKLNLDQFCDALFVRSSMERIENHRYKMQLAIAKKNTKEIEYHHKIASEELKILRDFFDNQQKLS